MQQQIEILKEKLQSLYRINDSTSNLFTSTNRNSFIDRNFDGVEDIDALKDDLYYTDTYDFLMLLRKD